MKILETVTKIREFDGKTMQLGKVLDYDNLYRYHDEDGKVVTYIPTQWIILSVANNGPI